MIPSTNYQLALDAAEKDSTARNDNHIGTDHLLIGLLRNPHCMAVQKLVELGVNLAELESIHRDQMGEGNPGAIMTGKMYQTPRLNKVLKIALRHSQDCGLNLVRTEHLLYAIMKDGGSIAADVLGKMNIIAQDVQCLPPGYKPMLQHLSDIEQMLPQLLNDADGWKTLNINCHPPFVERLWRDVNGVRAFLHVIHPCKREESLFHPHGWPSAMLLMKGTYGMETGVGEGKTRPPVTHTYMLSAGSRYSMEHPDAWHNVVPIGGPTLSLMVAGKPWKQDAAPKSDHPLGPLSPERKLEIIGMFKDL